MNVMITGGAGYIGSALVQELAANPSVESILVYDNLMRGNHNLFLTPAPQLNGKVRFMMGDILDTRRIRKALKGIDVVYHLAARVSTPFSNIDPHFFEQTNHWGTAELVYAVEDTPSVKKFIFVSSTSVYGSSKEMVSETTLPNPDTFYSISKLRAEQHVQRLGQKIQASIVRCGNVYGFSPCMRFDSVINKFMFDAHFNSKISINGTGKQSRAFIHIDRVRDLLGALVSSNENSGIYNLTDKNLQILDLVDVLKEIYPEMEFMFINQHMDMRDLKVSPVTEISSLYKLQEQDLRSELQAFQNQFGFKPTP